MINIDYKIFQEEARKLLESKWKKKFSERKINIRGLEKNFDFVSEDGNYIGDAKFYKNIKTPSDKFSNIAEYVWLLEKTKADKKFLIFGKDVKIPERWLDRFGYITDVEFYFYDMKKLTLLNKKTYKTKNVNPDLNKLLLNVSVWENNDFIYLNDLRKDMNKWKVKYEKF